MAQLYVLSGADVGRSFDVRGGDTLGRSQDCILVLKDPSVSRRHAHLEEQDGRWSVVDDGSRNGIIASGTKTRRVELSDGQEFLLGEVLLRFRGDAPAAAPPAPVAAEREPLPAAPAAPPGPPPEARTPAPAARPPAPPRAQDSGLVLEGAEEIDLASGARPAAPAAREGLAEQRGRILQYHRVAESGSALSLELAQLPAWKRYALYLLALLVLGGATAAAFLGAAFVKDRLAGGPTATSGAQADPGGG